jgi:hypothetical protein
LDDATRRSGIRATWVGILVAIQWAGALIGLGVEKSKHRVITTTCSSVSGPRIGPSVVARRPTNLLLPNRIAATARPRLEEPDMADLPGGVNGKQPSKPALTIEKLNGTAAHVEGTYLEQRDLVPHPIRPSSRFSDAHDLSLSVVIPTWNEAGNIGHVLRQLDRFDDIVIVDGQSEDDTVQIARSVCPDLRLVERKPRGKGDALRAGFQAATGDVIVIMDADGSMNPDEVDVFVSMIAVGFDLVKGSRLACGGGSHDLTFVRWAGNRALCGVANQLFHTAWTDLCYGYLAFRRDCLARLALTADGFEIETQILANAALSGMRVAEIPSIEFPRISGDSHLNARRDGTRILRTMLSARFAPRARRSAMALRPVPPVTER